MDIVLVAANHLGFKGDTLGLGRGTADLGEVGLLVGVGVVAEVVAGAQWGAGEGHPVVDDATVDSDVRLESPPQVILV